MKIQIEVQNLKCSGCGNTISNALNQIGGVSKVEVNVESSIVDLEVVSSEVINEVKTKLASIGYPDSNSENSLGKKAKSIVSCAIGRF